MNDGEVIGKRRMNDKWKVFADTVARAVTQPTTASKIQDAVIFHLLPKPSDIIAPKVLRCLRLWEAQREKRHTKQCDAMLKLP